MNEYKQSRFSNNIQPIEPIEPNKPNLIDKPNLTNKPDKTNLPDSVNHPSYYTSDPSGIECIDVIRHRDFNIGSAIKYLWRAGLKHDAALSDKDKQIEDLRKAIWYIQDEIKLLENG